MKKLFTSPTIEAKSLTPETEVMGVFSVAASAGQTSTNSLVITDTESNTETDIFGYWDWKNNK